MKHVKDLFTKNVGLKILSAVIAIIIWLIIVNIEDPEKSKVYTVPVTIEHADYLESKGKAYQVVNGSDAVSFTVTAKRSVIEELTKNDFTATADLEYVDESSGKVPISITSSRYNNRLEYSNRDQYMQLLIEELQTLTYPVEIVTTGEPAAGCVVKETTSDPEGIRVSGAESIVANVSGARVTLDIDGASKNVSEKKAIVLLDDNGEEIEDVTGLTLSKKKARVKARIVMQKQVGLSFATSGSPANGYTAGAVTSSVEKVTVEGKSEMINSLSTLNITSDQLNLSGKKESFDVEISLKEFLPDGVSLAEGEPETIKVFVAINANTQENGEKNDS